MTTATLPQTLRTILRMQREPISGDGQLVTVLVWLTDGELVHVQLYRDPAQARHQLVQAWHRGYRLDPLEERVVSLDAVASPAGVQSLATPGLVDEVHLWVTTLGDG